MRVLSYKEYIYAIYQEKSFSKAAQKLYVSQPWLSSVVKKVEQEIKTPLFDRTTNPISLTPAGRYYVEHVEQVMAIEDEMRQHFNQIDAQSKTELHIGSSMFFCTYVLPSLMDEFKALYPYITLTFTEGGSQAQMEGLLDRKLDFLLEAEHHKHPQIQTTAWASEEIVLAVPARFEVNETLSEYCYTFQELLKRNEPGRKKPPVPLKAFQDEPFLLLKEGNDIYSRSLELCRHAGFTPRVTTFLTQMMTTYYLVCEGQGVSFLRSTIPEYVTPTDKVVFYQLDDPLATRSIYLSYVKRGASPVQQKLIDFMWSRSLLEERSLSQQGAGPGRRGGGA